MGFAITYKTLFEVRILHHYHLDKAGAGNDYVLFDLASAKEQAKILSAYDMATFLWIVPTAACAADLRRHQCVFRQLGDRILVSIKVQYDEVLSAYKPVIPLADDLVFTFRYRIADPYFLNYSNLPLQQQDNTVYYFQNKSEGGSRSYPGLSLSAPVRDNSAVYNAGEILLSADLSTVLIADQITGPANTPTQTFTSDPQVSGNALRYVNRNDLIRTSGNRIHVDTGLQNRREHVLVTVANSQGAVVTPMINIFEDGNTMVQLDFGAFTEGVYNVHLEDAGSAYDEDVRFYLQKEQAGCDGIVQLQVKSDLAAYNMLNGNGTIKEGNQLRRYELRFKNRATVWRYLGENFSNQPESGPHLLARRGFLNLSVPDKDATVVNDVPNASVGMIKTEKPVAAPQHYNLISEIYVNS